MPYLAFLFICVAWGASFILMDRAGHALGPVEIGLCRLLGGAFILSLYWAVTRVRVQVTLKDLGHIAVVAIFANSWPFVIQPYTMIQAREHAYFGMLVSLVPLITILVSIPMLGVYPSRRQTIGVVGGMLCMLLAVQDGTARGISPGLLALALTVPVTYALGNTYVKWKLSHLPALPLTTLFLAVGGLAILPLQFMPSTLKALELGGPTEPTDWPLALGSVALLSVLGTGIAILLFVWLIKHQGPLFAGMVTYVVPVQAIIWGQYDRERLTVSQVVAICGVLVMVALVQWRSTENRQPMAESGTQ